MRRKKHKQTRRAVNYFKVNYGFHEPYKVLLDGNFIHATMAIKMGNLDNHVPKLLGGNTKLYTTRCISRELKSMGPEFHGTANAARGFLLHKCDHDSSVSAAQCIKEQIGARNESHWFVATQDQALRQALNKVPGCPVVFATVNGIHLETPSELTKQLIQQVEEQAQRVQQHEKRSEALQGLEELRPKLATSVRFRKKKAKGPNPLAIRKKATKAAPQPQAPKQQAPTTHKVGGEQAQQRPSAAAADAAAEAKRRRKRRKGGDGAGAAD